MHITNQLKNTLCEYNASDSKFKISYENYFTHFDDLFWFNRQLQIFFSPRDFCKNRSINVYF